ncbi:MAG TPA: pitrilysin family protein [Spirochaetia bacterium]|nr:pitrilysin family protein [Spirochaetia bacterium]
MTGALLTLLAAAMLLLGGCATVAPPSEAPSQSVLKTTLANGLRVVIVRNPLAPVVTQQITYLVGGNESPEGFPGMAHAQEHMMFRGAPGLSGDQLSEISAQLGGNMDAYTTQNTTTYFFTVPADDLDLTLRIGAIRMAGVNDTAADWQTERGAIEQEVAQDNSNPLYVLEAKAQAAIFRGTPYANTGLGTKDSFDKTTSQMLASFHSSWYAPNNALLVVAGDVEPEKVLATIQSLYGSIPRKSLPTKPAVDFQPVQAQSFSSETDQPYGIVAYIFRMPGYTSPDFPAANLLARILDSRRGAISALSYNGKALGSGFVYQTMVDTGFAIAWAAFPPGGNEQILAVELKAAVNEARSGIPQDLVTAERRKIVLASALERNSISGLAQAWTNTVALQGLASPDDVAKRLEAVDTQAVDAQAQRLLDFNHAVTLVLTPSSQPTAQPGSRTFGTPESFASTPTKPVTLPDWAQSALAKLPHPVPLFKPHDTTLANGIRLIIQPLPASGAVSLYGSVHTNEDLQSPQGKEGVGGILDSLFEWGPRGMTRDQFEAGMDALGAGYSTGTSFSLQLLPAYFDQGVKLLADDLLHPALPEDAFKNQQRIEAQSAAGRIKSPLFQFNMTIQRSLLPAGDPYLRISTPESISSLTLADVRDYYDTIMRPDETTIVVMGNVDPQKVAATIEKYFGEWKATGPKPTLDYPRVPLSVQKNGFVSDPVRQQDQVVLAETLGLTYNDPVHYAIGLGNAFVGGDTFASPLYRELRVQRGLVYFVGSSAGFGRTRSDFQISFGAYPDKVNEAKQLAVQIVKSMADTPLTDAQLHLAKASSLRKIEMTNQSVGDVANGWIGYAEDGLSLNRLYYVADQYEKVTSAEIQEAFGKYIDMNRLSTFILGQPISK